MIDKPHVFISYSRTDTEIMQRVKQDMEKRAIRCWTDEGIEPGTRSWKRAIETAIREAGCLICILSPDSADSHWVEQELTFAENLKKPIQLLLARGDETNAVPFGYATYQWVDIRENYETGMAQLIPVVARLMDMALKVKLPEQHSGQAVASSLPDNQLITDIIKKHLSSVALPDSSQADADDNQPEEPNTD